MKHYLIYNKSQMNIWFIVCCRHTINEQKRTIAAYVTGCSMDAVKAVCRRTWLANLPCDGMLPDQEVKPLLMQEHYRAVAKCHPDDIWNEETGTQLALQHLGG